MRSQDQRQAVEKFVVGLGNPGRQYERTRHNVGFRVVDELAWRWQADQPRQAFDGLLYDARASRNDLQRRVRLLKPMTYMNLSGRSVRQMADFFKAAGGDVLVVLDDMALPLGRVRARADGSAGGHNGLADVITAMGGDNVPRLRIGIGASPAHIDAKDYVLTGFGSDEEAVIAQAIRLAADAVEDWVFRDIRYVMDKYNRRGEVDSPGETK